MGVHGLWDLLAPVGRRVSVETLAGKRLAIDASIWMIQFMKAMRDERGEMVRNAHLIGFFRRICKLLFLRTKPVFVFDGGTPALKRRTVIARRRQRENAQAKIRKTAEKLLLNHVKAMKLKELADNLQNQKDMNNSKGKEVLLDKSDSFKKNEAPLAGHNQEMVDEMLAASILVEESGELDPPSSCTAEIGSSSGNASTSAAAFPKEDEEDEDDGEMILPITDGNVDPAVLAALPPSMQLDLLAQMRERLMAENRQKYQKVKKAPEKFSALQIEAYLKTVAFRREIDQVQRAAAGKGVGGVQTSRIASESNREFIFSSSFSGDKQLFASDVARKIPDKQQIPEKKDSSYEFMNVKTWATKSIAEAETVVDEALETFIDERGRRRISRRRAMGIRMTRDLQRNIDLMKEHEQEMRTGNIEANAQINSDIEGHSGESHFVERSFEEVNEFNSDIVQNSIVNSSLEPEVHNDSPKSETCIKISFDDEEKQTSLDGDDEFFAHLVAGDQVPICSVDNSPSACEWEDGVISLGSGGLFDGNELGTNFSHAQVGNNNESDVEWEEGDRLISDKFMKFSDVEDSKDKEIDVEWQKELTTTENYEDAQLPSCDVQKTVSKGSAEEEAALQEAIRRSLEDSTDGKISRLSCDLKASDCAYNRQLQLESCSSLPSSHLKRVSGVDQSVLMVEKDTHISDSHAVNSTSGAFVASGPATHINTKKDPSGQQLRTCTEKAQISNLAKCGSLAPTDVTTDVLPGTQPDIVDDKTNDRAAPTCNSGIVYENSTGQSVSVFEEQPLHSDVKKTIGVIDTCHVSMLERSHDVDMSAFKDAESTLEPLGFSLEDELVVLDQEYKSLGDEQRKLERNADSVNAEMFVECQELLQMFGLPYIIAPMEAEAQCAYMEIANLVDGVVTDDSDVFLFGAKSVYKNIFDDRKYVETYFMKDIETELGLNREKIIRMALLLGSDYTEGVSGIGIVNAIEVLNAFPEEDGLNKFREWIESPDPAIFGKVGLQPGLSSKKKVSKASKNGMSTSKSDMEGSSAADSNNLLEHEDSEARNGIQNIKQIFMNKHRNVSKNWHIPASFPSDAVISAYVAPQVDKSTEPFAWGKPDLFSLRRLCWDKFGWASQKADELLLPVLKEYNKHETQLRLEAFYTFNERFAKIRSKRIQQAVKGITAKKSLNLDIADDMLGNPAEIEKSEASASGNRKKKSIPNKKDLVGQSYNSTKRLKSQRVKGNKKDTLLSEEGSTGRVAEAQKPSSRDAGSSRVRGRRRRTAIGRGRRRENSESEHDETSIHDYNSSSDEHEHEVLAENIVLPDTVRRSKRARKAVKYMEEDEKSNERAIPLDRTSKNFGAGAGEQKVSDCFSVYGADVANSSRPRELTSEDLPGYGLPGDHSAKGGGFCADEDEAEEENSQLGSLQKDTATIDTKSEYLQIGGGFCADEDEVEKESNELDSLQKDTATIDVNGEYLQMGGGFCADEDEAEKESNQLGSLQKDTATIDANSEYLQMGGGFCVDDEDNGDFREYDEGGASTVSAPASVVGTVQGLPKGLLPDSKLNLVDQQETTDGKLSNVEQAMKDDAPASVNPFSALPYLKRKRRKA